jgi:uncharacterized protein YndB with AHSA1/START domain
MPTPAAKNLVAKASTTIDAPRDDVWAALVDARAIERYMFGADVVSSSRGRRTVRRTITSSRSSLSDADDGTRLVLTQDNNATEEARKHSEQNWSTMLEALKQHVEGASR